MNNKKLNFLDNIPITDTYWPLFDDLMEEKAITMDIIREAQALVNKQQQMLEQLVGLVNPKLKSYETLINREKRVIVVLRRKE